MNKKENQRRGENVVKHSFFLFFIAALFLSSTPYHVFAVETDPLTGLPIQTSSNSPSPMEESRPSNNTSSPMEESHPSSNTPSPMEATTGGQTSTGRGSNRSSSDGKGYTFLAPLPTAESDSFTSLADFMVYIYITMVGLAIIFAVIMVIWGGVQYILGALTSDKEGGKKKIQTAVLGLLFVLLSYLILQAINPALLKVGLNITQIDINSNQDSGGGTGGGGNNTPQNGGGSTAGGKCSVLQSGACSPSSLSSYFPGKENSMSSICNYESAGGNARIESGSDRTRDGHSFSIGLFQINLTVTNTVQAGWGVDCTKAFSGKNYKSTVSNMGLYTQCAELAKDPTNNLKAARMLYYDYHQGIGAWANTARKCGVS